MGQGAAARATCSAGRPVALLEWSLEMAKQPGLDHRHRDKDGQIREKNGNTRIDTLRETYGDGFAAGMRGDAHLRTLLEHTGADSLTDYLKHRGR